LIPIRRLRVSTAGSYPGQISGAREISQGGHSESVLRFIVGRRIGVRAKDMAIRDIVVLPHKALTSKAAAIDRIDDRIRKLALDMAETMYQAPGLGLAANQVGVLLRLIVVDAVYPYAEPEERKKNPVFVLNPKICVSEGESVREEGCLSVPEFGVEIKRAERVLVEGLDLEGKPLTIEAEDILARVLQHEIEHLEGKTILDHASALKRGIYNRRLRKKSRRER